MSGWNDSIADPIMSLQLLIAGFGFGLLIAPITAAAINNSMLEYRGAAAGIISSSRFLGMTFGIAAISAWGSRRFQDLLLGVDSTVKEIGGIENAPGIFESQLLEAGITLFHNFFFIGALLCLVGVLPCLLLVKSIEKTNLIGKSTTIHID